MPRIIAIIALAATLIVAGGSLAIGANPDPTDDRPFYLRFSNAQNIFDNWRAWDEYVFTLNEEAEAGTTDYADATEEAYSATVEFWLLATEAFFDAPVDSCREELALFAKTYSHAWVDFYGAWHYKYTADVGGDIDTGAIADLGEKNIEVSYTFVSDKCFDKLDA